MVVAHAVLEGHAVHACSTITCHGSRVVQTIRVLHGKLVLVHRGRLVHAVGLVFGDLLLGNLRGRFVIVPF